MKYLELGGKLVYNHPEPPLCLSTARIDEVHITNVLFALVSNGPQTNSQLQKYFWQRSIGYLSDKSRLSRVLSCMCSAGLLQYNMPCVNSDCLECHGGNVPGRGNCAPGSQKQWALDHWSALEQLFAYPEVIFATYFACAMKLIPEPKSWLARRGVLPSKVRVEHVAKFVHHSLIALRRGLRQNRALRTWLTNVCELSIKPPLTPRHLGLYGHSIPDSLDLMISEQAETSKWLHDAVLQHPVKKSYRSQPVKGGRFNSAVKSCLASLKSNYSIRRRHCMSHGFVDSHTLTILRARYRLSGSQG